MLLSDVQDEVFELVSGGDFEVPQSQGYVAVRWKGDGRLSSLWRIGSLPTPEGKGKGKAAKGGTGGVDFSFKGEGEWRWYAKCGGCGYSVR